MIVRINDDKKLVFVWLKRSETNDTDVRDSLKPMYRDYKNMKYKVAVFISGTRDLTEQTICLLKNNLNIKSQEEVSIVTKQNGRV